MPVVVPVIVNIGVIHANDPLTDVKAISHVLGAPSPKMMLSVPPYAAMLELCARGNVVADPVECDGSH